MDLTNYKNRLGQTNVGKAINYDTALAVSEYFSDSPQHEMLVVNDEVDPTDVHIKPTKKYGIYSITFKPSYVARKGIYLKYKDTNYISTEAVDHEIYPKVTMEICPQKLSWKKSDGTLVSYPCAIKGKTLSLNQNIAREERLILNSEAEIMALIQYNSDTKEIKLTDRFLISGQSYEVIELDTISEVYEEDGLMSVYMKSVANYTSDDLDNGVSDGSDNSGWGDW
jgi:hypothetical protein